MMISIDPPVCRCLELRHLELRHLKLLHLKLLHLKTANVSPLQRKVLGSLVKLPISKRTQLEKFLASHYQAEVFGTLSGGEAVTPKLSNSSEIWRLIRSPVVCVPLSEDIDEDCKFSIGFECNWDPEHGIEIRFDSNDAPVEVGSQGDFF